MADLTHFNIFFLQVRSSLQHTPLMSSVRLFIVSPFCSFSNASFFLILGLTGQPKAFLTRADREACVCSSQVGTRVQGFPRQHRHLHEPSGLSPPPPIPSLPPSACPETQHPFLARQHRGVPKWRIYRDFGRGFHPVCLHGFVLFALQPFYRSACVFSGVTMFCT